MGWLRRAREGERPAKRRRLPRQERARELSKAFLILDAAISNRDDVAAGAMRNIIRAHVDEALMSWWERRQSSFRLSAPIPVLGKRDRSGSHLWDCNGWACRGCLSRSVRAMPSGEKVIAAVVCCPECPVEA